MEFVEVQPKEYPTNILPHVDWVRRKCYCWSRPAINELPKIHDMHVRDDDVWLVTLPKCGTTWMQELVWLLLNDNDFERARSEDLEDRSPFLEFDFLTNGNFDSSLKALEDMKSPRLIKTHLPLPLLPSQLWTKKPKVIYVYRNPKDYLVSLYHFIRSFGRGLDETIEEFIQKKIEIVENSSFDHVTEFYALRHEPWVYYTSFERMKMNLDEVIRDVCKFLYKSISEEQMQKMMKHLSFPEMKNNPRVQHTRELEFLRSAIKKPYTQEKFMRKGKVNAYNEELSEKFVATLNEWIEGQLKRHNVTLDKLLLLDCTKCTVK